MEICVAVDNFPRVHLNFYKTVCRIYVAVSALDNAMAVDTFLFKNVSRFFHATVLGVVINLHRKNILGIRNYVAEQKGEIIQQQANWIKKYIN